jgi:hypothetical protein
MGQDSFSKLMASLHEKHLKKTKNSPPLKRRQQQPQAHSHRNRGCGGGGGGGCKLEHTSLWA